MVAAAPNQHHKTEIIPESFSDTISDSIFKNSF